MLRKFPLRSLAVAASLVMLIVLAVVAPGASADGQEDQVLTIPEKRELKYPNLGSQLDELVARFEDREMSEGQATGEAAIYQEELVAVTVHLSGDVDEVVEFLAINGGDPRNVGEDYIETFVPVSLLGALSQRPGVIQVREIVPPQPTYGNVTSQAVGLHQANSWHNVGLRGQGVKVGVIDVGFAGYSDIMGVELPANVVARCYTDVGVFTSNLADCEAEDEPPASTPSQCRDYVAGLYAGGDPHGTAVTEAVIDIAPDATLYIANPRSWGDLRNTVDWMSAQGVQVINHSVGWLHSGPGDGSSPFSGSPLNTVDQAQSRGITWVNAAGNSAQDTWFGSFSDNDGDGVISFNNSTAEINPIALAECRRYVFQLRWEDSWGGASTDLDIYLYDRTTSSILDIPTEWGYVGAAAEQSGASNHYPIEVFSLRSPINSRDVGVIIVRDSGPVPDWVNLELFSGPGGLGYSTGAGSIGSPAESDNPGLLAVGAAPFYDTNTIEPFSSLGPTPDGRVKPDIVGVDCAAAAAYEHFIRRDNGQECWFPGTSQAAPHVAGLAALVRQRFPDYSPVRVAEYLKQHADRRGDVPNNTWGYGFAQLPSPDPCVTWLTGDDAVSGRWDTGCDSEEHSGSHAQYFTFTLAAESDVTINLESADADSFLYLREGEARSGTALHENDDHDNAGLARSTDSQIQATLPAGTYTIEATTYSAGETSSFTLAISGLGTAAPPSDDPCLPTNDSGDKFVGVWDASCESETPAPGSGSGPRFARFLTIEVPESEVAITLESQDADTYLYLREGYARSGTVLYENDDHDNAGLAKGTDSQIQETLPAGTYTIEATTYSAGETGEFTLTVTVLGSGGGQPTPDPDPADDCGFTIPAGDSSTIWTFIDHRWYSGCESEERSGSHAQYFTFTLAAESDVTINLESADADSFLYLREGEARSGTALHENDDHDNAGLARSTDSQIQATLPAGTYTIEATTYSAGETGSFTLAISGLGTAAPPPDDPCLPTNVGSDAGGDKFVGVWDASCDSQTPAPGSGSGPRFARFLTIEVQESEVTITLESQDADAYLYLREGYARSGTFLYENDDHDNAGLARSTDSQIRQTLPAGTYTVEATTYDAGETGGFTLTVYQVLKPLLEIYSNLPNLTIGQQQQIPLTLRWPQPA